MPGKLTDGGLTIASDRDVNARAIARMIDVVGPAHAIADADRQQPYLRELRDLYKGAAALVLRPGTTLEVAQILAIAHEAGIGIVPQGGNTGLVGGQTPSTDGSQVVLSLARLNRVRAVDGPGGTVIIEAGATLAEAQAAAAEVGRLFPLSLPSEGSCQIGGVLATNAGGVGVLAYGNARALTLGLEVVTADGQVWDGLRTLKKDNTGYDLRDLFVGSEGTLGIITAAALKLFPRPAETAVALAAVPDIDGVAALFRIAEARGSTGLTAFEFMSRFTLDLVLRHIPSTRLPLNDALPWYVLLEVSSAETGGVAAATMERVLAEASERRIVADAVIAGSLAQSRAIWRLRETASEAQRPEGGSIKHDVSVPVARIPQFIGAAAMVVERICSGARPVVFGHFGDGNVHYNVTQPAGMDKAKFLALWKPMSEAVHDTVAAFGGSISAEHGIGQLKRGELLRFKSPLEIALMRKIKSALDPKGILNPGKLL
ncbi:MAG: FAD-binding oxidoreductase [Hyphomicrobium sp.]